MKLLKISLIFEEESKLQMVISYKALCYSKNYLQSSMPYIWDIVYNCTVQFCVTVFLTTLYYSTRTLPVKCFFVGLLACLPACLLSSHLSFINLAVLPRPASSFWV